MELRLFCRTTSACLLDPRLRVRVHRTRGVHALPSLTQPLVCDRFATVTGEQSVSRLRACMCLVKDCA